MSHPSSSFTTIWGKNVPESSQFSDATGSGDGTLANGQNGTSSSVRVFTLAQLRAATYNFRSDMLVGRGGFGYVYKGWLKEKLPPRGIKKTAVAVKKLDSSGMQGLKEWKAEVYFLGAHSHPNLVKLLGYCSESVERILVYEFMKKGSLNYHLFGTLSSTTFMGHKAQDCYRYCSRSGLLAHIGEANNLQRFQFYNAKLSDFGLSFWGPLIDLQVSTRIAGTVGYMDPEYIATGKNG
uniref:non-specific serine/threonine protein kinase n=1 Tax=Salix viminalis TaxID=40686 RepID=A0A6N2N6I6_SALVM